LKRYIKNKQKLLDYILESNNLTITEKIQIIKELEIEPNDKLLYYILNSNNLLIDEKLEILRIEFNMTIDINELLNSPFLTQETKKEILIKNIDSDKGDIS